MWGSDYSQSSFLACLTTLPVTPNTYLVDDTDQGIDKELEEALITRLHFSDRGTGENHRNTSGESKIDRTSHYRSEILAAHDKWVPVTTKWRVLRLRMEERLPIGRVAYWISSRGQPTRGGPPPWGLDEVLTAPHSKNIRGYEIFNMASDLDWSFGTAQGIFFSYIYIYLFTFRRYQQIRNKSHNVHKSVWSICHTRNTTNKFVLIYKINKVNNKNIFKLFIYWVRTNGVTIVTGSGHLWMRWWTFGFHKMLGISWLAANRLASREGLCCTEWVSKLVSNK